MKHNMKLLLLCIAIPLLAGGLSGFLSRNGMEQFQSINQPPLSPPGFLFPIVWTILYLLMGIASYLVLTSDAPQKEISQAIRLYLIQLGFNFFWSLIFFNLGWYFFAFIWLLFLWFFIYLTIQAFFPISKSAACLLIPYLLWVTFAGYLNLAIALLN